MPKRLMPSHRAGPLANASVMNSSDEVLFIYENITINADIIGCDQHRIRLPNIFFGP